MDTNKERVSSMNNAWEQSPNDCDEICKQHEEQFGARVVDETIRERGARLIKNKVVGTKHDQGKLRWSLLPWWQLEEAVEVLEIGAANHGADNWRYVEPNRFKEALLRHVVAYIKGEYVDKDSGKSHLAHIVTNALFLMWHKT
jgi:mannose/cellobiose epimerase-like protein (N-acyl-D-glucosamine 2-epimerase family)